MYEKFCNAFKRFCPVCALLLFTVCFSFPAFAVPLGSSSNAGQDVEIEVYDSNSEVYIDDVFAEPYIADSLEALASPGENYLPNAVRFDVSILGVSYVLYFPTNVLSSLSVDSDGRLWNTSTSNISGRAFIDSFDALESEGYLVTLTPSLGNNFATIADYGSPNYIRHYYYSSGRLTYSQSYAVIQVQKSYFPYLVSENLTYIIIFMLGVMLICLWKKSLR